MKVRNYSFQSSKRLPEDRMTEINGVTVPSMPGSCYHAIICALAENKDQFCPWLRLIEKAEKYMRQYGGDDAWEKFKNKPMVKNHQQRIKDNTHTLTRSGKDCYGRRLHERGMAIYFFQDGAMLLTGGEFKNGNTKYKVDFSDGRGLQTRYRGTTMTYKEYKKFLAAGFIKNNGEIVNSEGVKQFRAKAAEATISSGSKSNKRISVNILLDEGYNQDTATRLESMGLIVTGSLDSGGITGIVPISNVEALREDADVLGVTTQ